MKWTDQEKRTYKEMVSEAWQPAGDEEMLWGLLGIPRGVQDILIAKRLQPVIDRALEAAMADREGEKSLKLLRDMTEP